LNFIEQFLSPSGVTDAQGRGARNEFAQDGQPIFCARSSKSRRYIQNMTVTDRVY
jgi:hypothetical protein